MWIDRRWEWLYLPSIERGILIIYFEKAASPKDVFQVEQNLYIYP